MSEAQAPSPNMLHPQRIVAEHSFPLTTVYGGPEDPDHLRQLTLDMSQFEPGDGARIEERGGVTIEGISLGGHQAAGIAQTLRLPDGRTVRGVPILEGEKYDGNQPSDSRHWMILDVRGQPADEQGRYFISEGDGQRHPEQITHAWDGNNIPTYALVQVGPNRGEGEPFVSVWGVQDEALQGVNLYVGRDGTLTYHQGANAVSYLHRPLAPPPEDYWGMSLPTQPLEFTAITPSEPLD